MYAPHHPPTHPGPSPLKMKAMMGDYIPTLNDEKEICKKVFILTPNLGVEIIPTDL